MIYGIIFSVCLFIFSYVLSYFFSNKWLKVNKDDENTLSKMEVLNALLYEFAKGHFTFIKDCDIYVKMENGKVVSVQTETKRSIQTLFLDEQEDLCVSTAHNNTSLRIARFIITVVLYFLLLLLLTLMIVFIGN